LLLILKLS